MKKLLLTVLALSLAFSLAACAASSVDNSVPVRPSATATPVPSVNISDDRLEDFAPVADAVPLEELMADFSTMIQAGSAGSSLKAVAQAVRLMDWGMDTVMTEEEIYAAVAFYLSELDDAALAEYMLQLELLDASYKQLLLPGQEDLLETAGCLGSNYPWTDMPIRSIETFFTAAGVRDSYQLPTEYQQPQTDPYAELARDYALAFLEGWDEEYIMEKGLNLTLIMEAAPYEPFSFLGYASHDINGDGIKEFIIGDMNEPSRIYDIYSLVNGEYVNIFTGWSRNVGFICSDGTVVTQGSGGAAVAYYSYYKFDGSALKVFGSVIHEGNASPEAPWFISADDDMDISNDSPASEAQALGLINQYEAIYMSFELKPLSSAVS